MLPQLLPMLAVSSEPFDAPDYHFEIKWDGVRALGAVAANGWRLWGRQRSDYAARYPELQVLRRLPAETLVDGELVVLRDGLADLKWLLRRHHLADPCQVRWAWRWCPVRYVLFDVLYWAGRSLLSQPFAQRRALLAEVATRLQVPEVMLSSGVMGAGTAFYAKVVGQGHEGVMAKHLAAPYRPGRRSLAWRKIKPRSRRDDLEDSERNCLDVRGCGR
jgi:bifunctional non-homologous end joining protein LigD